MSAQEKIVILEKVAELVRAAEREIGPLADVSSEALSIIVRLIELHECLLEFCLEVRNE